NPVVRDWVTIHYANLIDQSFGEVNLAGYSVDWVLPDDAATAHTSDRNSSGAGTAIARAVDPSPTQLTVQDADQAGHVAIDPSLNSKYTFESFVVGSCNQFAHAASLAVAQAPGKTYNPLYLYGGVGLGKTHLMHACGHAIKQRNPHLHVSYLYSERFIHDFLSSIRY